MNQNKASIARGASRRLLVVGAVLTILFTLGGSAAMGFIAGRIGLPNDSIPANPRPTTETRSSSLANISVADLVEDLLPSIVTIEVRDPPKDAGNSSRGSIGAGFFYAEDGMVLTNSHVLPKSGVSVQVALGDGTRRKATIVGRDLWGDIAVLKVEGGPFPPLPLGDSDAVRIGEAVLAIGSPFNLRNSVSMGIVSGKERTFPKTVFTVDGPVNLPLRGLLQTDATVNKGNSGGPLIDLQGNVVGINTASRGEGTGIGLALAISDVRTRLDELERTGTIEYGFLGIRYQIIDPGLPQFTDSPHPYGALIGGVIATSTAHVAGVKDGDVLLAINGQRISRDVSLSDALLPLQIGNIVQFTVSRDSNELTLKALLQPRPKALIHPG